LQLRFLVSSPTRKGKRPVFQPARESEDPPLGGKLPGVNTNYEIIGRFMLYGVRVLTSGIFRIFWGGRLMFWKPVKSFAIDGFVSTDAKIVQY